jgi:hypothetical protein
VGLDISLDGGSYYRMRSWQSSGNPWIAGYCTYQKPGFVGASLLAMDVNDNAFIQEKRIIVNVHREQARSYRGRIRFTDRHLADEAGFFVECRGKTIHLCRTVFDQTIRTTFGNAIFDQTIRTISRNAILDQPIRAISCNAIFDQPIRTISGNAILDQAIRTISGNAIFDQPIRTISGNAIFDQPIRTTLSHTAFNQPIRTTFSNYRVSRSSGESVHCKNRESDAEKDLAFHDGVLRGVVVWYGGDVTPRSF